MKYNLFEKKTIEKILSEAGFTFKKSLGQNFLTDPTVCPEMAAAAADEDTGVLEIGPGIGVLTAELCEVAKKVVTIELDERLRPVLAKTLADYDNLKIIFGDAMKINLKEVIEENFKDCKRVAVCANLPYYITSPIIMMLLESRLPIDSITVMIQKEAAQRLCAEIPSRQAGAVTLSAAYYSKGNILFDVGRESFTPSPNVDSTVIRLDIREKPPVSVKNEGALFRLIRGAFTHRRKTLVNSVSNLGSYKKEDVSKGLESMGLKSTARAEELSLKQFAALSDFLEESI